MKDNIQGIVHVSYKADFSKLASLFHKLGTCVSSSIEEMSTANVDSRDDGSVTSQTSQPSTSHGSSCTDGDDSDNESNDWILEEIHRQIDDQLQAEIDRQLEEQLWNEMDEQLEKQLDQQIQNELNQQLSDMVSTPKSHLHQDNSRNVGGTIGSLHLLQSSGSTGTLAESVAVQQEASVSSINNQIQKIVVQYEKLNMQSIN